jgi:hypothetical protein
MGFVTGRRNLIINGAMQVHQRGADTTTNDTFGPDRYRLQFSGGGTTMSQEDMSSSDTPYSNGFRNFVRITNTTTTSGAGDYRQIVYRLEAQDIANSGWDYTSTSAYMTVSFWVRSSIAGKYYFTLETGGSGNDKYYGFSETLVADTWKKVEHSVPGDSTLTFANTNARGLGFIVRGWMGTNYTDSGFTEDTWGSFNLSSLSGDDLANWAGTTNSTLDIVGLQMEVGSNASDFEHRSFGEELAACQRYTVSFDADGSIDNYAVLAIGRWYQGDAAQIYFSLPVTMRNPPTLDATNTTALGTFVINSGGGFSAVTPTGISLNERSHNAATLSVTYSTGGQTAGTATTLYSDNADVAKIVFEAEL